MTELLVDWCSYTAAKYAVMRWHYSKAMPAGKLAKLGVWEDGRFIGAIIFSLGANRNIGSPYGLFPFQACELTRVALGSHREFTGRMLSLAIYMVKKQSSGLRLIVSYADSKEGHSGVLYQATNWMYVGKKFDFFQRINGKTLHRRTVYSRYGRQDLGWLRQNIDVTAEWVRMPPKHKYLYPLDRAMRRRIEPLAQPYPKREICGRGERDSAPQTNGETGGASPTRPLNDTLGLEPRRAG